MTSSARAPGAIVRKAKSFVIAQRVPMSSPATFAVLDLLVLLDQAKSTRKESVRKNFPINFSGIIPSQCLGDFLRGATLPPFVTKRWRQKCPQGTSVGIGRRFSLSGHKRLRCFARPLRALEPPSDLIPPPVQCGICGALRATMIYYDSNSSILKFSKPPRAEASARAAPWRRSVAAVDNTPPRQSRIKFALFSA